MRSSFNILHSCILVCLFLLACHQNNAINQVVATDDLEKERAFLMQVQQPAGNPSSNAFLPYPANYGVCHRNPTLEVLALTSRLSKDDKIAVYPIGTLLVKEANSERTIIVASPVDTSLQLITTPTYQRFLTEQSGMRQIIQDWFLYEKGLGKVDLVGWKDERYAWKLIKQ